MDLKKIIRKRADVIKLSLKQVYYRSDSSKNLTKLPAPNDLRGELLAQFKHDPSEI